MKPELQRIIDEILTLSPMERVELLDNIIKTFDTPCDNETYSVKGKEGE
jgi:hypothetical protein